MKLSQRNDAVLIAMVRRYAKARDAAARNPQPPGLDDDKQERIRLAHSIADMLVAVVNK